MLVVNVVVAALCALGVGLSCWSVLRSTRPPERGCGPYPVPRSRTLRWSAAIGGAAFVALMVVPRWAGAPLRAVLDPSSFTVLQYLAPSAAAVVALVGVPRVLRRRAGVVRVAGLRPRRLGDLVDRPALLLLAPCVGALAVVATALWQSGSGTEILLAAYTPTSGPHERVQVTQRDVGFSPGWKVLLAIAVAVTVLAVISWLTLRAIRDSAPARGAEPTAAEVRLRRSLGSIVLVVAAAAQAATAALVLLAAGGSMQGAELWTSARYTRVEVMGTTAYEFHPAGVHQLQPEWALATAELLLGMALLLLAGGLAVRAVRLIAVVSARSDRLALSPVP